jgi:ubiquinone/menaquinone biosynthesis C-methylase UbiE
VIGVDYRGKNWEYSLSICVVNAILANTADRVQFVKGNAAELEFPDEEFDLSSVISPFMR